MPAQTETQADMIARLLRERDTLAAKLTRLQEAAKLAEPQLALYAGDGRIFSSAQPALDALRSALEASRE